MRRLALQINPLTIAVLALMIFACVYDTDAQTGDLRLLEEWCCDGWVGDVDLSGAVDITDISVMIDNMFLTLTPLPCWGEADIDLNYDVNIADLAILIEYFSFTEIVLPDCPLPPPSGSMEPLTGCKTETAAAAASYWSADQSCIVWEYDVRGQLSIQHINAGLNCCPEGEVAITVSGGRITLDERPINGVCNCLCLFDIDMLVANLPPGEYTVVVKEPLWPGPGETFEFTVDLNTSPTGLVCVDRNAYPWGTF